MKQLDHYETLDKMEKVNIDSELYLFLCDISAINVGVILRSADIFGAKKVVYFGTDEIDRKKVLTISRNSKVDFEQVEKSYLDDLKQNGFEIVALEITDDSCPLSKIKFSKKTCLVVGNERYGVPQDILIKCDKACHIEMASKTLSSLNVGVATSIALYKFMEKFLQK